jgi:ribonuclease E
MELSRQRLRPSLSEGSHVTCPRCNGTGHIRDTESSALQVLRIIQEEAMKENSAAIHVQAPVDVAAFLLNEKRGEILKIENRHRVAIILIPNKHLETPHYKLERIKHDDPRLEESHASYDMAEEADTDISYSKRQKEDVKPRQEAMVKGITPDQPAPIVERRPVEPVPATPAVMAPAEEGFFSRMFGFFRKKQLAPAAAPAPAVEEKPQASRERGGERNGRGSRNRGRGRGGREKNEERDAARAETQEEAVSKKAQNGATDVQPTPRQPRPPREGNEARRERNNNERQQRQREERKEAAAEEPVLDATALVVENPVAPAPSALTSAEQLAPNANPAEEETSEQGEERRRRRRRGGRNRNRRDRENGEIAAVNEGENDDAAVAESASERAQLELPEVAMPTPVVATVGKAETAVTVATTVEAAIETMAPAVAEPAAEAEQETAAAETAAPPVAQEVAAEPEQTIPVSPAAVNPEPTPAAATPVRTTEAAATTQSDNLREVLAAAGLTLAVTDPDKLRIAQEAAARFVPTPRVPRERKPLPPSPTEPLVQVETRR